MTHKIDSNTIITDIKIQDVGQLPAYYFLDSHVIDALENAIRSDVVVHKKAVPPGVRAIYGKPSTINALRRLRIAEVDLKTSIIRNIPFFFWRVLIVWLAAITFTVVWSVFHG